MKGTDLQDLLPKKSLPRSGLGRPLLRSVGKQALLFLCSFSLCALRLGEHSLPLAAAMIPALPLGLASLSGALGALCGYLSFCEGADCLELLALTVLLLAAAAVFQGTELVKKPQFMPLMCAAVCAVLRSLRLAGGDLALGQWLLQWSLAGGFCLGIQSLLCKMPPGQGQRLHRQTDLRLLQAAELVQLLRRQLPQEERPACEGEAEDVFDGAAEQVCRCCERFHRCWQNRGSETYEQLSSAARCMIERGVAREEDFPREFRDRCCHLDGFLTAVNQELEGMLFRRRYRMQLQESRQVLTQQLECMEELLLQMHRQPQKPSGSRKAYLPRIGLCAAGKNGSGISGDRGACFSDREGAYYVLLCDGMGSGCGAQKLSGETVALLQGLLSCGLSAESALRLLNGTELLRREERFTTVDLLRLDLDNGEAVLYKWGAAPSYLRQEDQVKKLGTAAPPPGVAVGYGPQKYELSLRHGELLVLVSDGAAGEETENAIAAYCGDSPRELAALLICGQSPEDDVSAAVISLQGPASP